MDHELVEIYKQLHRIPELDDNLPKTKNFIIKELKKLDCNIIEATPSSVCAYFNMDQETTIAFRSDMDALPIREDTYLPYASIHEGNMHACGHDGHMTMLLGLAKEIQKHKDEIKQNVLLVFQPAEETGGGAELLCRSGIFQTYNVKRMYGFHIWPNLDKGMIYTKKGPLLARSNEITIEVIGKNAHCASFEKGIDALKSATMLLHKIYELDERLNKKEKCIIKFGKLNSGSVRNILSDYTTMEGTIRVFHDELFEEIKSRIEDAAETIKKKSLCDIKIHYSKGYPIVHNDEEIIDELLLKIPTLQIVDTPYYQSEDFSYYQKELPGVFFLLGTGEHTSLHSKHFCFDIHILEQGINFYKSLLDIH